MYARSDLAALALASLVVVAVFLVPALVPSLARADASVRVELKRKDGSAVDGTVRIKQGDTTLTCTTQAGACVITAPTGGSYTVEAEVPGAPKTKAKTAMIPPSGNVKLVVAVD